MTWIMIIKKTKRNDHFSWGIMFKNKVLRQFQSGSQQKWERTVCNTYDSKKILKRETWVLVNKNGNDAFRIRKAWSIASIEENFAAPVVNLISKTAKPTIYSRFPYFRFTVLEFRHKINFFFFIFKIKEKGE